MAQFSVEAVRQLLATWSGVPSDEPQELLITEAEALRLGIEPDELSRFTVRPNINCVQIVASENANRLK